MSHLTAFGTFQGHFVSCLVVFSQSIVPELAQAVPPDDIV